MTEKIFPSLHIIIKWEDGNWYKIPFIVIKDEADAREDPTTKPLKELPITIWYHKYIFNLDDHERGIAYFKEIFQGLMPGMKAYMLYNIEEPEPNEQE